jgi:hypothetical protein
MMSFDRVPLFVHNSAERTDGPSSYILRQAVSGMGQIVVYEQ